MRVLRPNFCSICGAIAQSACSICGQPICREHLDPRTGVCARCSPKGHDDERVGRGPGLS